MYMYWSNLWISVGQNCEYLLIEIVNICFQNCENLLVKIAKRCKSKL